MSRLLFVIASPRGGASTSTALGRAVLDGYTEAGGVDVDVLDVFADLVPFGARQADAKMAVIARQEVPIRAAEEWKAVQDLAGRLRAADDVVLATPMWNSGIPWALKLFIDTVTQPGIAFAFDPVTGYRGLLGGRRAVLCLTSRVFAPGVTPAFGVDHHASYLRWWLELCGIADVREVCLQPTFPTEDFDVRRAAALVAARTLGCQLACDGVRIDAA